MKFTRKNLLAAGAAVMMTASLAATGDLSAWLNGREGTEHDL